MAKRRVTLEVDTVELSHALHAMAGDTRLLGRRLATILLGEPQRAEEQALGVYGISLAVEPPGSLRAAAEDVAPHLGAWIALLQEHVENLPPDGEFGSGDCARSYAEHELRAMQRDLEPLILAALQPAG